MKLPFWATSLTILGVFILCSLGSWQLERLAWKEDLITKIQAAYAQENPTDIVFDHEAPEFTYGRIEGEFLADKAFLLGPPKMRDDVAGLELIVPVKMNRHTVLVNMGWTPHALTEQPIHHLNGKRIAFTGLLRFFSYNAFTPDNKPEDEVWYQLDVPLIAASKSLEDLYPAALIAERANYKFDAAFFGDDRSAEVRALPNNNHMQYALFWFAMAGALIVVYALRFIKTPKA